MSHNQFAYRVWQPLQEHPGFWSHGTGIQFPRNELDVWKIHPGEDFTNRNANVP